MASGQHQVKLYTNVMLINSKFLSPARTGNYVRERQATVRLQQRQEASTNQRHSRNPRKKLLLQKRVCEARTSAVTTAGGSGGSHSSHSVTIVATNSHDA